jgi:RNA polymerase sigma factor (sigma-70 family)
MAQLMRCYGVLSAGTRLEASALQHSARLPALAGRSPLLRLQTDERLVALIRRGHHGAFEALVQRYQPRLLAFCRHMLGSQEDAEDVLQEVFAASFNAICADDRPINARPWLYRIARNRCLNHLRRPQPAGQDSMDVFERDGGTTTADTVHKREEFRHIVADVQELPETQRTALLLREIDALSYEQIAEAMDTTVPSVKSLLVRARVALAEAAEARLLTCSEVRLELGQVAEGITRTSPPVRRHLKRCDRCRTFKGELRNTSKALAAIAPIGPLLFMKKLWVAKLGAGAGASAAAGSGGGAAAGAGAGVAGATAAAAGGITAGGAVSAGVSTVASKAAAGMAAAALVTAGAVEVKHATEPTAAPEPAPAQVAVAPPVAPVVTPPPAPVRKPQPVAQPAKATKVAPEPAPKPEPEAEPPAAAVPPPPPDEPAPVEEPLPPQPAPVQEEGSTVILPPREEEEPTTGPPAGEPMEPTTPPGEITTTTPDQPPPAPPAGEPGAGVGSGTPPPPPPTPPPPPPGG